MYLKFSFMVTRYTVSSVSKHQGSWLRIKKTRCGRRQLDVKKTNGIFSPIYYISVAIVRGIDSSLFR
jgi:hypothetical protein